MRLLSAPVRTASPRRSRSRGRDGVVVYEAGPAIGGGCRSEALTLPGFVHDVCSAVHPMAVASPFFQCCPSAEHGLEWITRRRRWRIPSTAIAGCGRRPIDRRTASRSAWTMRAYRRLIGSVARDWPQTDRRHSRPAGAARHPACGWRVSGWPRCTRPNTWRDGGSTAGARAAGRASPRTACCRSIRMPSGAIGLVLGAVLHTAAGRSRAAARNGSRMRSPAICDPLAERSSPTRGSTRSTICRRHEPSSATSRRARSLRIAGRLLPERYRRSSNVPLRNGLVQGRLGARRRRSRGAILPWPARRRCTSAARSPRSRRRTRRWDGRTPERPFVLLSQPTLFDETRAPAGQHTLWTYCHVPHGLTADMLPRSSGRSSASRRVFATASSPAT